MGKFRVHFRGLGRAVLYWAPALVASAGVLWSAVSVVYGDHPTNKQWMACSATVEMRVKADGTKEYRPKRNANGDPIASCTAGNCPPQTTCQKKPANLANETYAGQHAIYCECLKVAQDSAGTWYHKVLADPYTWG